MREAQLPSYQQADISDQYYLMILTGIHACHAEAACSFQQLYQIKVVSNQFSVSSNHQLCLSIKPDCFKSKSAKHKMKKIFVFAFIPVKLKAAYNNFRF
jgi:hypothetical protein